MISLYPLSGYAYSDHKVNNNIELENALLPFRKIASIRFTYSEIRRSFFFKKKQVSSGTIHYIKPDILIKHIIKPSDKKIKITQDKLMISRLEKETLILDINHYPQLTHFIHLMKAILSGDAHYIRQYYKIQLVMNQKSIWTLTLTPKDFIEQNEAKTIKSVQINVINDEIQRIKMIGFSGETSTLVIEEVLEIILLEHD